MEFIDGKTLRERLSGAPMNLSEVLDVAIQTSSAFSAAHAAGIVHRDLKPENIMLRRDGMVKVLDFGLAKLTEQLPPDSIDREAPTRALVKTEPGVVMGTAIYMSPEQARGLPVDGRTDIFSFGIVLYEMVAGRLPFDGSNRNEIMASVLSDKEPQPLTRYSSEAPTELGRIVLKALRKDRDERYQTINDMLLDLQSLKQELEFEKKLERSIQPKLEGTTEVSAATTSEAKRHRFVPRRTFVAGAALVVLAVAGMLSYVLIFRRGPATPRPPEIRSLAVLPLTNFSGDPSQDYFADGMTEELTTSLAKIGALRVISRT